MGRDDPVSTIPPIKALGLEFDAQDLYKKPGMMVYMCNLSAGEAETPGALVNQLRINELQGSGRACLKK